MSYISMDSRLSDDYQSVGELWESIANLSQGRVDDNNLCEEYPLSVREMQLNNLKALVKALEDTHTVAKQRLSLQESD